MSRSWLRHAWTFVEFTLKNFAAPIAFFWVFQIKGAKPAIAIAVGVTFVQVLVHCFYRLKMTPFFLTASGFTLLFGGMDLLIKTPRFFRLEPFAQNTLLGLIFMATVMTGTPIVSWFAQALPAQIRPKLDDTAEHYLRNVTIAWSIYFFLKGLLFLYLAFRVDLGRLIILRSVIGGVSFVMMFGAEYLYRTRVRGLPSRWRTRSQA
jgi:uncharacterized membrane protein